MIRFNDLSIRSKLIVLLGASAAIALLISSVMTLYSTFTTQKEESLRNLRQISEIGSENLRAALAFRDGMSASRMLGAFHANPHILAAVVHDNEGQRFGRYVATGTAPDVEEYLRSIEKIASASHQKLFVQRQGVESIVVEYMYAIVPIDFEGEVIGTLTIVSDNQALERKIVHYITIQALISLSTLGIIFLISMRLQKTFTDPIYHMIAAIREVSETKNYSVSVGMCQNDEFRGLYTHFNAMLAEIRERDDRLNRLATTDPLTGLANRRHAMEFMETLVERARRRHEPVGVIMLDIDHFKRINDTHGHPVGDVVLREVAAILAGTMREYDLLARIGGEEFLVLCDNGDAENTRKIAERMRVDIEKAVIQYDGGKTLQVTISVGVHSTVPVSDGVDALLKVADLALYEAKAGGRNRVVVAENT